MTQAQGKEMAKLFVPKGFTILCLACSRNFISTIENLIQSPLFHITLSQCFPILSACPRTTTMQHIKNSAFVHANSRSYKSSIEYLIQTQLFHFAVLVFSDIFCMPKNYNYSAYSEKIKQLSS